MKLSDFFEKAGTKQIVINTDIDGFLSGMILCKYYGCEVVGFSNSKKNIWLRPDVKSLRHPVYVDIFLNDDKAFCIDQHIIAVDNAHAEEIFSWETKMNPNLDVCRRTFLGGSGRHNEYKYKYPFGTVHYLIALMKQDGIEVEFKGLNDTRSFEAADEENNKRECSITIADIILRADDAMNNTVVKFSDNSREWWERFKEFRTLTECTTTTSRLIVQLSDYLDNLKSDKAKTIKKDTEAYLMQILGSDEADGGFYENNIVTNGNLNSRIISFCKELGNILDINMELPTELVTYTGKVGYCYAEDSIWRQAYTYAFISGPKDKNKEKNKDKDDCPISYTLPFRRE